MSESTRALCQIVERRPFLTLTDNELEMIVTGLTGEALRQRADDGLKFHRLAEVVWQELKQRRADKPQLGNGDRCDAFATPTLGPPLRPLQCEDLKGHDGPHFVIDKHGVRREWR
jgi:hypothetical protein